MVLAETVLVSGSQQQQQQQQPSLKALVIFQEHR
jgi:hypothetical protein